MAIPEYQFFDGAALSIIAEARGFIELTALKDFKGRSYVINHNTNIYIKHAKAEHTAKKSISWLFTFSHDHIESIEKLEQLRPERTFIVFVCKKVGVCALAYKGFATVVGGGTTVRSVTVFRKPKNGQFQVRGPGGEAGHIPISDFPDSLF